MLSCFCLIAKAQNVFTFAVPDVDGDDDDNGNDDDEKSSSWLLGDALPYLLLSVICFALFAGVCDVWAEVPQWTHAWRPCRI